MTVPTMTAPPELPVADPTPTSDAAWIRPWLRAEGVAVFAAGLAGFLFLGLPWWAFPLLLLVPDVSAIGYLRGPRVGAIVYNLVHDLATGVLHEYQRRNADIENASALPQRMNLATSLCTETFFLSFAIQKSN